MKILLISPKIPFPPDDGHKKSIFGVIKYLNLAAHEIDVIAYRQNDIKLNTDGLESFAKLHILDVNTKNSLAGIIKNLFSRVPYNLWKYERTELKKFLREFLSRNHVDIIQVTNAHMGWVIKDIRKLTSAPVVLRQENLEMEIMRRYSENQKNPLLKLYSIIQLKKFINYEPELCGRFDLCVLMSKEDEKKLLKLNPKVKTAVNPVGVDEELLSIVRREPEPYSLVHIGSLNWYPNLDGIKWFLNEVFPQILVKEPRTKLYLYGGGIHANYEFDKKIKSNIVLKGFVEDIWFEISNKALAIVPLRIGGGIRVKILEMLAAGQNVITTSLGAEGIPVTGDEHLIIADSPEQFSGKILNHFNGGYDSKQLSFNGRQLIRQNFVWPKIAAEFEKNYKKLLTEL